jgi:hypothetical protein
VIGGILGTGAAGAGNPVREPEDGDGGAPVRLEWLPSWATTLQSTEPDNLPPALANNTLRQFVWPTVSGREIRIQLSNEKGSSPVEIQKIHIGMASTQGNPGDSGGQLDPSTEATFTFGGVENVTIPAGQTVWSDALDFSLQEIRLTAVTLLFGDAVPTEITGHPGSRTTSYVVSGDAVSQQGLAGAQTRDRWYFINAIEVMAPSDAYAIALLGDSITDGYGVLNQFARWPDFMTLAIQNDPRIADTRSVLDFGMGANNLTSSSTYQDAGVLRFERDVLTRDKIKWLVVFASAAHHRCVPPDYPEGPRPGHHGVRVADHAKRSVCRQDGGQRMGPNQRRVRPGDRFRSDHPRSKQPGCHLADVRQRWSASEPCRI